MILHHGTSVSCWDSRYLLSVTSSRSSGIIYSTLWPDLSTCLLALLDDVRFNAGHSFCFSQAHVLWSESTGYQWDYWHHIFCVWNLYFIANHFWKQVKIQHSSLTHKHFCDMTPLKGPPDHILTNERIRVVQVSVHEYSLNEMKVILRMELDSKKPSNIVLIKTRSYKC